MSSLPIVFAHGLEGAPDGRKISALREAGLDVIAPDGRGLVLVDRIAALEEATRSGPVVLGGSSYGGLAAAWLAAEYPDRFHALLLCAPALHWKEEPVADPEVLRAPPGLRTHILHGREDTAVPLSFSERYQARSGAHVTLEAVDDGHRLIGTIPRLVAIAQELTGG